ncbi:MAG: peptidoglycan-associated lipoprotein Pal [Hyphomicrobiales bacterium]|nr:peptidoglycan-associated lipoprotein Pal [Hyphomicrobiales bacterium]
MRIMLKFRRFIAKGAVLAAALTLVACSTTSSTLDGAVAAVPGTVQDFVVNAGDRVFFETDSAELSPQSRDTLDKQAAWLKKYSSYPILIEGHADERGTREYNLALGARRATATRNYLVSRGVDVSRLRTISYGKERPVAVCDDISCWSQNRRAVTVIGGSETG